MSLYDFTTSYMQNPFVMQMPYTSTFQTSAFSVPSFSAYPSIFNNVPSLPIMNTFGLNNFGFTPTLNTGLFSPYGINPAYNIFPYSMDMLPSIFSPTYTPQYSFGSLTGNISNGRSSTFNTPGNISKIPKQDNKSAKPVQPNQSRRQNVKKPTVSKALRLAVAEIGTAEINGSNDSLEIRKYKNGIRDNQPWCASFISWLYGAGQNNDNKKTFGYSMHSQTIRRRAQNAGFYSGKNSGYVPKPGDLMILKYSNDSGHIGIVTKVHSDGSFETIEGNSNNRVRQIHRDMDTAKLDGFVRMDDWLKAA